ncbi:MAG: GNAT family N-acetyltransferase [Parvibaculum sp.]
MSVVTRQETARLLLRSSRISDAKALLPILGDEPSRPYTFNLVSLREARRYIAANECQRRKLGYGLWIVIEKSSGQIVGFGGLYDDPFDVLWGPEIAYHFTADVRGKGYATELTLHSLNAARELNLPEVRAFAHPDNVASKRVLEKAGFIEDRFVPEMDRHLYSYRPDQ